MMQQPPPQGQPIPPGGPPPSPSSPPQQPPVTIDAVMGLLRDGAMRRFRIDIEVDSTITGDESQERADRTQFIESTTKFVEAWGPIVAANPSMAQLAGELLLFGVRAFRVGRSLEEVVEETVDKLEQQAAQPKPPPPIPPEEQAKIQTAQIGAQAEGAKAQATVQGLQIKGQTDQQAAQVDMAGKVMDHQHKQAEHAMSMEQMQTEAAVEAEKVRLKGIAEQRSHMLKLEQMEHAAKQAKEKPKGDK
jgi:hypothetical protein